MYYKDIIARVIYRLYVTLGVIPAKMSVQVTGVMTVSGC